MRLSQESIRRMTEGRGGVGGGGGSFDPSALAGYATQAWTEENYISKTFFNELFIIHKKVTTVVMDGETEISRTVTTNSIFAPNEIPGTTTETDEETGYVTTVTTEINSIESKKGFWTNYFISALGLNSEGGGGGLTLNEPLATINVSGLANHPSSSGQTIVWNGSAWVYGTAGGGTGTVTGVKVDDITYSPVNGIVSLPDYPSTMAWSAITSKPTTIEGYGITDAKIENGVITLGSNTITPLTSSAITDMATKTWVGNNYLPQTGGDLTGNLAVKRDFDLSQPNNGISGTSNGYYGYYIKDSNNKRSVQYINTVSPQGNNSFWISVTYDVSGGSEKDHGFGLTVDKQGNCTWNISQPAAFRTAIDALSKTEINNYTWWGRALSNGVVNGDMTNVGNISFSASGKNIGGLMSFVTAGNGTVGVGTLSPNTNYKLDVNGFTKTSRLYLSDTIYMVVQNDGIHIVGGGLYADTYVSALGLSDSGSGTVVLNALLESLNSSGLSAHGSANTTVVWNGSAWTFGTMGLDQTALTTYLSTKILTVKNGTATLGTWNPTAAGTIDIASALSGYVTDLGTSGDYLTWTKNGTANNLTVPYATHATRLAQSDLANDGDLSQFTHATDLIYAAKGGGNTVIDKPTGVDSFGVLSLKTAVGYYGQILLDAGGALYVRSSNSLYGVEWKKMLDSANTYVASGKGYINGTEITAISGNAATASRLADNTAKTAWGRTYWSSGVPQNVSGNIDLNKGEDIRLKDGLNYYRIFGVSSSDNTLLIGWELKSIINSNTTLCAGNNMNIGYGSNVGDTTYGKYWSIFRNNGHFTINADDSGDVFLNVGGATKTTRLYLYKPNSANDTNAVYLEYNTNNAGIHLVGGGLYADTYVSALGLSDSGGSAFDETAMWQALGTTISAKDIALAYIQASADTRYALKTDVPTMKTLSWSYGSVTSASGNSYNGSTARSFVIPNATSHLTNDLGFITSSALVSYLPLTGGTINGSLAIRGISHQNFSVSSSAETSGVKWTGVQFQHVVNDTGVMYGGIRMDEQDGSFFRYNSSYTTYKIWDAGNDGADSGLDADLLDGQHGSYYGKASDVTTLQGYFTNGSAKTALKLNTAVSLWGQSFDGSADVSGNMTGVGSITMSGSLNMSRGQYVSFKIGNDYTRALGIYQNTDVLSLGYYTTTEKSFPTYVYGTEVRLFNGSNAGLVLNTSGNVGIGNTNPSYNLDVNGTVNCTSIRIGGILLTAQNNGIRVNSAGLYADTYVSALGLSDSGSGSTSALSDLVDVSISSASNGQGLAYENGLWKNKTLFTEMSYANNTLSMTVSGVTKSVVIQTGIDGVTSITAGTGLSGGTITSTGTIAINSTYQGYISNGNTAYLWGNHANAGYLTKSAADLLYIPLTGGEFTGYIGVTSPNWQPLALNSTSSTTTGTWVQFRHNGTAYGGIMMDAVNGSLKRYDTSFTTYTVLDSATSYVSSGKGYLGGNEITTISGNAASATKLQTARTLWGQSFDGSADVSGNMTGVGSITMSGSLNMSRSQYVSFKIGNDYTRALGIYQNTDVLSLGYYTTTEKSFPTYIYGADVRLFYGSNAGLVLDSSGHVGIGTSSPSYKLHVNGDAMVANSIYTNGHLLMHSGGTGIYLNSAGTGIDWHNSSNQYVSSLLAFTQTRVHVSASGGLRIGDGLLVWDSTNKAIKVQRISGNDVVAGDLYATGGLSALGMSAGVTSLDEMTFGYLTVNSNLRVNNTLTFGNNYASLYMDDFFYIDSSVNISVNGVECENSNAHVKRLYLDPSRYIYVSSGKLYYYNGSSAKEIAFTS